MSDRDRRAARDYLDRFTEEPTWDVYSPDAESALTALLTAARAEGAAVAIEAAAQVCDDEGPCRHVDHVQDFCACREKAEIIRALAPAGLVAVDRVDIERAIRAWGAKLIHTAADAGVWAASKDRIRAALARKEG